MSTVLEEKIPMVQHYLVEQYGQLSQSAVDTVAQGLKSAVSMGISSAQDSIRSFEFQGLGGPDTSPNMLGPLIGTKISEAAGVAPPEVAFQGRFPGLERAQNAELTAFTNHVFGQAGALKSLQEKGIIIICKPGESSAAKGIWVQHGSQDSLQEKGFIIDGSKKALNQATDFIPGLPMRAELQDAQQAKGIIIDYSPVPTADAKGFVIYGSENPESASGIVAPEYKTMTEMEQTLLKTLKLQQDLQKFNNPVRA